MRIILLFLIGVFACNGIPHFIQGITGRSHMTLFSKRSHPVTNVIWGMINFAIAGFLWKFGLSQTRLDKVALIPLVLGAAVTAIYLANFWSNPDAKLPWHK